MNGNRQKTHLFEVKSSEDPRTARLRIDAAVRSDRPISRMLTGKFCEHLGSNIYNGMCAQILRNPTFAVHPFGARGQSPPDGGRGFEVDPERIADGVRSFAVKFGLPPAAARELAASHRDGLAFPWLREGGPTGGAVVVSPDAGRHGGRAQRVEAEAGGGIAQYAYLPLHRIRRYRFELLVRSPDLDTLNVFLFGSGGAAVASASVKNLDTGWRGFEGELVVAEGSPEHALYRIVLTAPRAGQFVVNRLLLWPEDHIDGADPDVVDFLKRSRLPVLRWPGGNFVSAYSWEDGVGPAEARPTRPNFAWASVEPNLFGTDEFLLFCRNVGCEPMICINAGDGTPEEAARWVQYCNGGADTPMGRLRAENGNPDPYGVRIWEIGNELYGTHQKGWSTPAGYADRFRLYAGAMLAADPSLELYACGAPVFPRDDWNLTLFSRTADILKRTTDHPLVGGDLSSMVDPLDVFRDFMSYPMAFEARYAETRDRMVRAGIEDPRLAITELQLFAHLKNAGEGALNRSNFVTPDTLAEALYLTLYYHTAVRLAPFIELITHSATVNHGGGLRKERERVYANPCYYARTLFHRLAGAAPVRVELTSGAYTTPLVLSDLMASGFNRPVPVVDALAALDGDGRLLISLVNRNGDDSVELTVELNGFEAADRAEVSVIGGERPWSTNSLGKPEAIRTETSEAAVNGKDLRLTLPRHSVVQVLIESKHRS